ncbi:MAG TPA: response regulator [Anaerolineales bacterium]|nr:response regulator [Anaerolineales bacterium]
MDTLSERILLVDTEQEEIDLVRHQTLEPLGYQVSLTSSVAAAIDEVLRFPPDLILVNLNLPDLSAKDLLVALSAQEIYVPVVVMASDGLEGDVIDAFKLGAADYLRIPIREAEVASVVERVLEQVRERVVREHRIEQLDQANQKLKQRVHDLSTLFSIGKAISSLMEEQALYDRIVESAVFVSGADRGWLLLRKNPNQKLILSAGERLPKSIVAQMGHPWEDGLSTLVALSGESLRIHGEPLSQFKASTLGKSALVVPVKSGGEVTGVLVTMRKSDQPFSTDKQNLLEAVADYASTAFVNLNLVKNLRNSIGEVPGIRNQSASESLTEQESFREFAMGMRKELALVNAYIGMLVDERLGKLKPEQLDALKIIKEKLHTMVSLMETGVNQEESQ